MRDAIFWVLWGMLVLWIILKAVGVIQSPTYLELLQPTAIAGLFLYLYTDLKSSQKELRKEFRSSYDKLSDKIDKNNEIILKRLGDMISVFERQSGKKELLIDITKELIKKK